ncbi:MAG: adenylate/guanylate cyclase domain-containing protein, partial [Waterburya sp.]
ALGGQDGVDQSQNYRGQEVLTAYGNLELPGLDWAIIAEIEVGKAYQPLYTLQVQLLIASAIFLLLIALLAAIASSIFVQPVRRLIESTKKIATGELETDISVTSEDEIGQLAGSVEVIVDKLRHNNQELQTQQQENDTLLHNFLPYSAAERIKNGESLIADQSNQVTFLYAHVLGIAELSKRMSSEEVTALLTKLFNEFDETAEQYGMDRQTTIGADYIAVCGLSQPRLDHTKRTIDFALAMLDILGRLGFNYNPLLGLRIGIHSGSATAGVVGTQKYSYIIWGEDIYLVSRLYAQAEPNRIVLTRNAYERVADAYIFVPNPSVDIQGIGEAESWTMFTTPKIAIDKVDLVQSSFAKVVLIAETAAELFYQRLFELDPDLRALFKGDMKRQQRKLMSALAVAVEGLKEPEKILPTVQELGRRHVGYGAKSEHYDVVVEALLWSLEQGLGDDFTLPVHDAWEEALTFVSDVMKDAAADLEFEGIGA